MRPSFAFRSLLLTSFLLGGISFGAPLDPPQIQVVPTYVYPTGETFVGTGFQTTAWNGTQTVSPTFLYPVSSVPEGGSLILTLFARTNDEDGWGSSLGTSTISSWGPSVALRWATYPGTDRLVHLSGRALLPVYEAVGYVGPVTSASSVGLAGRMDRPSYYTLAADDGPGSDGVTPVDPVMDYVVLERTWQAYDTTSWTLTGPVVSLPVNGMDSFVSLRAGTPTGPSVWSNITPLLPGPSGSLVTSTAGREHVTVRIQPFAGSPLGLSIADFQTDFWPQPQGGFSMPPEGVKSGVNVVDGGVGWSVGVGVSNVFPGGRVFAEIEGSGATVYPVTSVAGFGIGPTLTGSFPTSTSSIIPQASLIPAGASPDGSYTLNLWHEFNGVRELLASLPYEVKVSLKVRSSITEISK